MLVLNLIVKSKLQYSIYMCTNAEYLEVWFKQIQQALYSAQFVKLLYVAIYQECERQLGSTFGCSASSTPSVNYQKLNEVNFVMALSDLEIVNLMFVRVLGSQLCPLLKRKRLVQAETPSKCTPYCAHKGTFTITQFSESLI